MSSKKWRAEHPEKVKLWRKKDWLANREKMKIASKKWHSENPNYWKEYYSLNRERRKEGTRKYVLEHPEEVRENSRKWALANPKKIKASGKKYYSAHSEELKKIARYRYLSNREKVLAKTKKWRTANPEKVAIIWKKNKAKRRQLGFIPLNKAFPGSDAHHTGREIVIYIPAKLHKSVPHSVLRNYGMEKINLLAWDFLSKNGEYCENTNENQKSFGQSS